MKTMGDRIRYARKAKGFTQKALADVLGISRVSVTQWESNDTKPELKRLSRLADLLGGDVEWYLGGKGEFLLSGQPMDEPEWNEQDRPVGDVPQFNIHAGMGAGGALSVMVGEDGLAIDPEDSDGFWSFPDSVKSGMRDLRKIYAMPVTGDSMEPTLPGGSFAFVDTSHTVPSPEDIYALDYGDGLMVKRIQMIPKSDKLMVISDNDHYRDHELLRDDVRVYGRVVAWFQWRG